MREVRGHFDAPIELAFEISNPISRYRLTAVCKPCRHGWLEISNLRTSAFRCSLEAGIP
jgi:hypothetical protein